MKTYTDYEQAGLDKFKRKLPWDGLGAKLDPDGSLDDWANAAGLNWSLDRHHEFYGPKTDGTVVTRIPNRYVWARSDNNEFYAQAGHGWQPLQNMALLKFFKDYAVAGGLKMEIAGALQNGRMPFGLARIDHSFDVSRNDRVESFLLFTAPHVVGKSIRVKTLTMRLACFNGMTITSENQEYSQSHIGMFNFDAAKQRVESTHEALSRAEKRFKTLHKLKMTIEDAMKKVILPVVEPAIDVEAVDVSDPSQVGQRANAIFESILNSPGAEPETGWGVLNGVTHWADHVHGRLQSSRLASAWTGPNERLKLKVESKLMELV